MDDADRKASLSELNELLDRYGAAYPGDFQYEAIRTSYGARVLLDVLRQAGGRKIIVRHVRHDGTSEVLEWSFL